MSTTLAGPMGPATASKRGTMSAAHYTKLDALMSQAALEVALAAIVDAIPDTTADLPDSSNRRYLTDAQQSALHAAVTLDAVGSVPNANGASLSAQALTLQPADETHPGVITTGAQTLSGAKTLSGAILNGVTTIAEAVTALVRAASVALVLRSSLGAGSTDRCVVVGSSDSDGNNNATAKQLSIGTGVGGSYVERQFFQKSGMTFWGAGASILKWDNGTAGISWQIEATPGTGVMRFGNNTSTYLGLRFSDGFTVAAFGFEVNDGTLRSRVTTAGRFDQQGTDSTGAPGSRTGGNAINKPTGKSSIANGQTTCQIENSLVAAGSRVIVTMHANPGAHWWVTTASGSFTVNVASAVGADTPFSWQVSTIL